MLTDPKMRSTLGLMDHGEENAIKRELIDPLEATVHSNHHHPTLDDRLRLDAKHLPHNELTAGEPPLSGMGGVGPVSCPRTGALLYAQATQPTQNKQPLQGFDQIWGPSRSDMNQRLHTSVGGMSHYWPPYDSQPACPTPTTPGDPPQDVPSADGQLYTITVLHESPEHGIVWSDSNALESPVPLAPDIAEPGASYEPTVDCFNFDGASYDLADYYTSKPSVQPHHHQQSNVPLMGSPAAPPIGGHLSQQHQPATAISLHNTVEGLLNEIQLASFNDRGPIGPAGDLGLQASSHSLYNEPSSYLYDGFAVNDSSSTNHAHHQAMLPSLAESSTAMTAANAALSLDGKLDTNNNSSSCSLAELNPLPAGQIASSTSSNTKRRADAC
uniref:Uncharacterized protein n=1 Tax=Anopheles dirus TaxID=7168 RepID=A0A182NQM3_9DIPT